MKTIVLDVETTGLPKKMKAPDGTILTNERDIAQSFMNHFVEKPERLRNGTKTMDVSDFTHIKQRGCSFYFKEVTINDVRKAISRLKSKNNEGVDQISPKVLKEISETILVPLTASINKSLIEGSIPRQLKEAIIVPVHKNDDKEKVVNYRPVSI